MNSGDSNFKDVVNKDLSSGVEPEILVKPNGDKNYYSQDNGFNSRLQKSDFLCRNEFVN